LLNATVSTGQISWPDRRRQNTAAALPTWPYATDDWNERIANDEGIRS
jgi:hypothetical protein